MRFQLYWTDLTFERQQELIDSVVYYKTAELKQEALKLQKFYKEKDEAYIAPSWDVTMCLELDLVDESDLIGFDSLLAIEGFLTDLAEKQVQKQFPLQIDVVV